eukprot:12200-Heterococcus_DN1.PRE.1
MQFSAQAYVAVDSMTPSAKAQHVHGQQANSGCYHSSCTSCCTARTALSAESNITLSGNALDTEGAKAIAFTAAQPSCALRKLCLDHAGLGHAGEKHIAAGLLSNSKLALTHFTGFRLGLVFMELGMPHQ